jgi:hypothetical protein
MMLLDSWIARPYDSAHENFMVVLKCLGGAALAVAIFLAIAAFFVTGAWMAA